MACSSTLRHTDPLPPGPQPWVKGLPSPRGPSSVDERPLGLSSWVVLSPALEFGGERAPAAFLCFPENRVAPARVGLDRALPPESWLSPTRSSPGSQQGLARRCEGRRSPAPLSKVTEGPPVCNGPALSPSFLAVDSLGGITRSFHRSPWQGTWWPGSGASYRPVPCVGPSGEEW